MGADTLTGGDGADAFRYSLSNEGMDLINDFVHGVDKIQLMHSNFGQPAAGQLAANLFWVGSAAHDADDRIIYNSTNQTLYYDSDGTGVAAAVALCKFATPVTLDVGDIFIY